MTTISSFEERNLQSLLEKIARDEGFNKPTFSIENGVKPGENFVGRVFRVSVTEDRKGKEKSLSLIFKASSTNRSRQILMQSDARFVCESDMYQNVLPAMNELLNKHGLSTSPVFPGTPRCFAVELNGGSKEGVADVIVLQDLKVQGYNLMDLKTGFGASHCRAVLEKLALFHGSSMALFASNSPKADQIKKTIGSGLCKDESLGGSNKAIIDDLTKAVYNGLALLKEPYVKGNPVYDRLYKFYENFEEEFAKMNGKPADISCVSHSDCTSNNILFTFNKNGDPDDVCLIDFQSPGNCSPVNDVSTVLLMNTTKQMRDQHYEELLQFYHDKLSTVLRTLGHDPDKLFPWNRFQSHLKEYGKFGLIFALMGLPVFMANKSDTPIDIHSSEGDENLFADTVKITDPETLKLVSERLTDLVTDAVRWGYI